MDKREYFNHAFLPCYRRMFAEALRILRDRDAASDVVQQSMLTIWEKCSPDSPPDSPEAFSLTVVRRVCISTLRASRPTETVDSIPDIPEETDGGERHDQLTRAVMMLRRLPDKERTAIRLRAVGECSTQEIAEAMHESPANVRQLLSRGRRRLRDLLKN